MALLLRFFPLLPVALAQGGFESGARLEANVTLEPQGSWHLGGFCFGYSQGSNNTQVGELWVHVQWAGARPLEKNGPVVLAAFDARPESWGAVKDQWGQKSCEDKLQAATWTRKLGQFQYWFRVDVHQETMARDWHFALLTCGQAVEVEPAPLTISVEAVQGALATFAPNMAFDDSSCPVVVEPSWWENALNDTRFWVTVVSVILFSFCAVLVCIEYRHLKAECARRRGAAKKSRETALAKAAEAFRRPSPQTSREKQDRAPPPPETDEAKPNDDQPTPAALDAVV